MPSNSAPYPLVGTRSPVAPWPCLSHNNGQCMGQCANAGASASSVLGPMYLCFASAIFVLGLYSCQCQCKGPMPIGLTPTADCPVSYGLLQHFTPLPILSFQLPAPKGQLNNDFSYKTGPYSIDSAPVQGRVDTWLLLEQSPVQYDLKNIIQVINWAWAITFF